MQKIEFEVNCEIELTKAIINELPFLSRFDVKKILQNKDVKVNNQRVKFIKQLEVLIDFLKTHQDGKAIDLDCFKTALYNIYLAKGMNEKTANNLLYRTIKANMKRAQKCFNSNAENCFITGKTQNLEI